MHVSGRGRAVLATPPPAGAALGARRPREARPVLAAPAGAAGAAGAAAGGRARPRAGARGGGRAVAGGRGGGRLPLPVVVPPVVVDAPLPLVDVPAAPPCPVVAPLPVPAAVALPAPPVALPVPGPPESSWLPFAHAASTTAAARNPEPPTRCMGRCYAGASPMQAPAGASAGPGLASMDDLFAGGRVRRVPGAPSRLRRRRPPPTLGHLALGGSNEASTAVAPGGCLPRGGRVLGLRFPKNLTVHLCTTRCSSRWE